MELLATNNISWPNSDWQFLGNSIQQNRQEDCKTTQRERWLGDSKQLGKKINIYTPSFHRYNWTTLKQLRSNIKPSHLLKCNKHQWVWQPNHSLSANSFFGELQNQQVRLSMLWHSLATRPLSKWWISAEKNHRPQNQVTLVKRQPENR